MSNVIAILVSDIHAWHAAPVARAAEPCWFTAMRRGFDELGGLQKKYEAPVICAGDVTDRPNPPPELLNFLIECMPEMWSVTGQHDLYYHDQGSLPRTGYCTLMKAGKLRHLTEPQGLHGGLWVYPFPWGAPITPIDQFRLPGIHLAVIHKYIWSSPGTAYPGAPPGNRVGAFAAQLAGYDVAHFGDNHKTVITTAGGCQVYNPGTFYRRKSDERAHRPQVGLLTTDGTVTPHYLDTSEDKWADPAALPAAAAGPEFKEFLNELAGLGQDSLDFRSALKTSLDRGDITGACRRHVLAALETARPR